MEFNKKCNYSCHSQKPWYFVRMVQDFYCCPSYYENKFDECRDERNECRDERRNERKCDCNKNRDNYNWEKEFENRYWNNQYNQEEDNRKYNRKNGCCCNRNFYY